MREKELLETITDSILDKKGKEITIIDLSSINYAFCDYFVVCHGDSITQTSAIAESVGNKIKEKLGIHSGHIEGLQNARWILMDYGSVVVHIFLKEYRDYYKLEDLWGDAQISIVEGD
ncbi:MAG: ribosome silencing factor [Bacteroidales bacterium]|nr:ribosome silencing factor [Bacteroidales bacterium]